MPIVKTPWDKTPYWANRCLKIAHRQPAEAVFVVHGTVGTDEPRDADAGAIGDERTRIGDDQDAVLVKVQHVADLGGAEHVAVHRNPGGARACPDDGERVETAVQAHEIDPSTRV